MRPHQFGCKALNGLRGRFRAELDDIVGVHAWRVHPFLQHVLFAVAEGRGYVHEGHELLDLAAKVEHALRPRRVVLDGHLKRRLEVE